MGNYRTGSNLPGAKLRSVKLFGPGGIVRTMTDSDSKKPKRGWRGWLTDAAIAILILAVVFAWQTWDHVDSGTEAPSFELQTLQDGSTISSESLRGKPTLVYFWAPWCGVCDATSENVATVNGWVGDSANVVSIALSYKSEAELREFAAENGIDYPVLEGGNTQAGDYAVTSFPTFYILDAEGRVRSSVVGYTTTLGLRLRLWLAG